MNRLQRATIAQQGWLWATAAIAVLIDQVTKWQVEANYELGAVSYPLPGLSHIFRLVHVYNRGAAFGTLQEFGWFFSIVAIGVTAYLLLLNYQTPGEHRLFRIVLGLIMGGALGNVIDRFRLGHVTDFIHFNFRPLVAGVPALDFRFLDIAVFNWADTFIVCGVILLGFLMWTNRLPEEHLEGSRADAPVTGAAPVFRIHSLASFEPVVRHPEEVEADPEGWQVARFGLRALFLVVVGTVFWMTAVGLTLRRSQRGRRG